MPHSLCLVTNGPEDQDALLAAVDALKYEKSLSLVSQGKVTEALPADCLFMPVSYKALSALPDRVSPDHIVCTAPTAHAPVHQCAHCNGRTDTPFVYYKDKSDALTYLDFMPTNISASHAAMPHTAAKVTAAYDCASSGRYTVVGGRSCPVPHPLTPAEATLLRQLGINLWLLPVFEHLGNSVSIPVQQQLGLLTTHGLEVELDHIYLDLDDTLVVHGALNPHCLSLLTKAKESGCPVTLITRHYRDPLITLAEHQVPTGFFQEICWIRNETPKSSYMDKSLKTIFIDDAYRERIEVITNGIPSYPPDITEILVPLSREA